MMGGATRRATTMRVNGWALCRLDSAVARAPSLAPPRTGAVRGLGQVPDISGQSYEPEAVHKHSTRSRQRPRG